MLLLLSSSSLLPITWLTEIPDHCLCHVQTVNFKCSKSKTWGRCLNYYTCTALLMLTPIAFGLQGGLPHHHINGPVQLPSSFSYIFYSCFIITSVLQGTLNNILFLSSAAQPKACSKHTHEISRLRIR